MKINITMKISLIVAVSLLISTLLTSIISIEIFRKTFTNQIDANVLTSESGANMLLGNWRETLEAEAKMIASQRMLIEDVESKNYFALQEIIDIQVENTENDHLMITDLNGLIVAGNEGVGRSLSKTKIFKAAKEDKITYQWLSNDFLDFDLVYAAPIKKDERIIGVVFTGFKFSEETKPDVFKKAFSSEFTFFKGDMRYSTTLRDKNGKRLVGTKLQNKEIVNTVLNLGERIDTNNIIQGEMYRCVYSPLKDFDNEVVGMLFIGQSQNIITKTIINIVLVSVVAVIIIFAIMAFVSYLIIARIIIKPIVVLKDSLVEISEGDADLTHRIEINSNDEIGDVVEGFNKFILKLRTIVSTLKVSNGTLKTQDESVGLISKDTSSAITDIVSNITSVGKQIDDQTKSVQQTAGAVNEISANIESLNKMIEGQAQGISQASAAIEQMMGNISSVNVSVEKMAESFEELSDNADISFNKQKDVNEKVQQIEKQSAMLADANKIIASIASQTNLLAMNAAIEAAHAGEAGKGFSVVADEIRKLSETSTMQSKSIGEQLSKIRDSIENVVSASNESSSALGIVTEKIRDTDQLVLQINKAMEEQTEGSKQINEALKTMNDGSVEVRSASKEMSEGNKLILEEVRLLQDATLTMKNGMNEISIYTDKINDTGTALGEVVLGLNESIEKISSEIDRFKV